MSTLPHCPLAFQGPQGRKKGWSLLPQQLSRLFNEIQKEEREIEAWGVGAVVSVGSPRVRPSERQSPPALCTWEQGGERTGRRGGGGREQHWLSHAPATTGDTKGGCKTRIVLHPLSLASVVQSLLQSCGGKRAP